MMSPQVVLRALQTGFNTGVMIFAFQNETSDVQDCICVIRIHSIPLTCAECDDSLPFSGASSIPLCYVLFPATLLYQPFVHPLSPHLAICFLVYLSILLLPNSYIIPFWEFYFLPLSVHAQTKAIYSTLLPLLQ